VQQERDAKDRSKYQDAHATPFVALEMYDAGQRHEESVENDHAEMDASKRFVHDPW
jgi:hypothetical protein